MATMAHKLARTEHRSAAALLRIGIVVLALATGAIHATLGGPLFTLNAIGYATLAAAMIMPGPIARNRWLVRLALLGFTVATIAGWLLFGARFPLAYLSKGIEVVLVLATLVELWRADGGPIVIARRIAKLSTTVARTVLARA